MEEELEAIRRSREAQDPDFIPDPLPKKQGPKYLDKASLEKESPVKPTRNYKSTDELEPFEGDDEELIKSYRPIKPAPQPKRDASYEKMFGPYTPSSSDTESEESSDEEMAAYLEAKRMEEKKKRRKAHERLRKEKRKRSLSPSVPVSEPEQPRNSVGHDAIAREEYKRQMDKVHRDMLMQAVFGGPL